MRLETSHQKEGHLVCVSSTFSTKSIPDALSRDMEAAELSDSAVLAFCVDITKSNSLLMSSCTAA